MRPVVPHPRVRLTVPLTVLRRAVADYMRSEGCDCCSDRNKHAIDKEILARLLNVPVYKDRSGYDFGYDFGRFETPRERRRS